MSKKQIHTQIFLNEKTYNLLKMWVKINGSSISSAIDFFLDRDKLIVFTKQRLDKLHQAIDNGWDVLADVYNKELEEEETTEKEKE